MTGLLFLRFASYAHHAPNADPDTVTTEPATAPTSVSVSLIVPWSTATVADWETFEGNARNQSIFARRERLSGCRYLFTAFSRPMRCRFESPWLNQANLRIWRPCSHGAW